MPFMGVEWTPHADSHSRMHRQRRSTIERTPAALITGHGDGGVSCWQNAFLMAVGLRHYTVHGAAFRPHAASAEGEFRGAAV